ncbi:MAG: LLM class F420-dependent oxidoreductase [Acidimicrobiia bacterium]|nr:MAG: LLM class F420-dependent oxidoreductase [Acidimicrobiia bacterium]
MRIGLAYANSVAADDPGEYATRAEALGFESLWTIEHVVVPAGYRSPYPYSRSGRMAGGREDFSSPDPLVWLAFAAAATSRIRLATGVIILPQRNPLVLAKEVATLDHLSGGRVILGVGVGWLEEEFRAIGVPFTGRGARADEYVAAMRALWTEERASYSGRFVEFDEVYLRPQPVQRPVPIVVGGHSPRAARRAGELGDGFFPAGTDLEALPGLVATAREWAERAGRDPAALEVTMGAAPSPDAVERLAAAGVDRVAVPAPPGVEGLEVVAGALGPLLG